MPFKSVHARFILVLIPLFVTSFVLLSAFTYYLARDELMHNAVLLSRSIGSEAALRARLAIDDIHLPLKLATSNRAVVSGESDDILPVLSRIKASSRMINQTFYIRPDGITLRADGKILDRSSREYFKEVIKTKEPYISKPFLGETTKKLQAMVLQPVLREGELSGILMASVHLDHLMTEILSVGLINEGSVYITDGDGFVVGCSENGSTLIGTPAFDWKNAQSEGYPFDPRISSSLHTAVSTGEQTVTRFKASDSSKQFATITPFKLSGNVWTIISTRPLAQVTEPARRLMRIMAFVFFVVLSISVVAILVFAHSIARPLETLAHELKQLNVSKDKSEADSLDEIEVLADGLGRMRELHDKSVHYEQKASFDELTGLFNRFGLWRAAKELVEENQGGRAFLIFADLDHLKHINDEIGHAAGDLALKTAATLLRDGLGTDAVIGRMGGDEFVAFMTAGDVDPLGSIRERAARFNEKSGLPYYVELSTGMTEFVCNEDTDLGTLLEKADECLYEAKARRRATSIR